MKEIEFEGGKYEVPDWVTFVARSSLGSVKGYRHKPVVRGIDWDWTDSGVTYIAKTDTCLGWRDSLIEV